MSDRSQHGHAAGSRAGVWIWITGMFVLGGVMPFLVSPRTIEAFEMLDVDLPQLTVLAIDFGRCLRNVLVLGIWAGVTLVVALPGFFSARPGLQRPYLFGGIAALLTLGVFAWAVHSTMSRMHHALSD